jgi:hypothetical protein
VDLVKLLLDTHALIWWLAGDEALSRLARQAIASIDRRPGCLRHCAGLDASAAPTVWAVVNRDAENR